MSTEFYTKPPIPWVQFLAKVPERIKLQPPPFENILNACPGGTGHLYITDHRLMRVDGMEGSLWAFEEGRDFKDSKTYGKFTFKQSNDRPPGSVAFERFNNQNIDILKIVEDLFNVKVFDEFGLTLE